MTLKHLFTAGGLALASLVTVAAADAQPVRHERVVTRTVTTTTTRHPGPVRHVSHRKQRVCKTVWRNHRKVRNCFYR